MTKGATSSVRAATDRLVQALVRTTLGIFFRRVEVVGAERIPRSAPLIAVGNHANSLIDPMLLMGVLPRLPRFLAKSTLWDMTLLRPFLALGGAVPVYRRKDTADGKVDNASTFARCHEVLQEGGSIGLFPEGISHNEPTLAPLKTGAARILLEAEERFGPLGTRVVPIGLSFDEKERFRSRVLVMVGEPIDPSAEIELAGERPREAARRLTARIDRALRAVTLNYPSWQEAELLARAADLLASADGERQRSRKLASAFAEQRLLLEGYAELEARYPEHVATAAARVAEYDESLDSVRLADAQVAASYAAPTVARFLAESLIYLVVALPLALIGTVINVLPYRLAGWIARRASEEPDTVATYKLFPSLVLFPAVWALTVALAAWGGGKWWALLAFVLGPLSGWVALSFHDRRLGFFRETRAFVLLKTRPKLAASLRSARSRAQEAVVGLADLYRSIRGAG